MNDILIYEDPHGQTSVQVRLEGETVWLTQEQMAQIFERDRSVITKHLRNVFQSNELDEKISVTHRSDKSKLANDVIVSSAAHVAVFLALPFPPAPLDQLVREDVGLANFDLRHA